MKVLLKGFVSLLLFFVSGSVIAQLNAGGLPLSFSIGGLSESYQHISLSPPDGETLEQEDAASDNNLKARRFAKLVPVGVHPLNSGTWESLAGSGLIWRLKLSLQGSLGSSLYFTDFSLPGGVRMFVYNETGEEVKGAFTSANNRENGLFATELIYSGTVILELNVPAYLKPGNWFTISEITYGYSGLPGPGQNKGFGGSDFCEVNINCSPEGDQWQDEKRGVVRIQVKASGSAYWCTGSLINNTSQDKTPYLLTADHCAYKFGEYATEEELGDWIFYFNYESVSCDDPQLEPQLFSLTGCKKIAHDGTRGMNGSDFFLVKLLDNIPASYHVYFNGWSTVHVPVNTGVTIHHPDGDIKKVSTHLEAPVSSSWQGNGLPSHWKVIWAETLNNWGVTEGGSSGAPLFDDAGRLVGTLTGGLASCTNPSLPDYYGKFSYHWESNGTDDTLQLKPWLDPGNTGVLSLNGLTMGTDEAMAGPASGMIVFPNPAEEVLKISFSAPDKRDSRVDVLNVMGEVVFSETIPAYCLDISLRIGHLPPGLYILRKAGTDLAQGRKIMKR